MIRNSASARLRALCTLVLPPALLAVCACVEQGHQPQVEPRLQLTVHKEDGSEVPGEDAPWPVDTGANSVRLRVVVEALDSSGAANPNFNGFVRISGHPGVVHSVTGEQSEGRNVLLQVGRNNEFIVEVDGSYGITRLWAEDVGYVPADPHKPPQCSDGVDNNGNYFIDYPADPGCAFANDDSEEGGTYATGVSQALYFKLPRIADAQGRGTRTPFYSQQVRIETRDPAKLIVTRVSTDGFYVADITDPGGYNNLFAYTFNVPDRMRACDQVTSLSGTLSEFFGYTELNFPSYFLHDWRFGDAGDGECLIPDPYDIVADNLVKKDLAKGIMERYEASIVRVAQQLRDADGNPRTDANGNPLTQDLHIASHFGPDHPVNNVPTANASNCDLNNDGKVDFDTPDNPELTCTNACSGTGNGSDGDVECSEWMGYATRGNFRVVVGTSRLGMQLNTAAVPGFNPYLHKGMPLIAVTGTLRSFSGGPLNWTLEARCTEDLVYCDPSDELCNASPPGPKRPRDSCILPRTEYDPDEGTN
jgi:hypothetical protein